jgi:hypothetical protein
MMIYEVSIGTVKWGPDDTDAAKQAIEEVVGEPDSYPVDVTQDESRDVKSRYNEIRNK